MQCMWYKACLKREEKSTVKRRNNRINLHDDLKANAGQLVSAMAATNCQQEV